MFKKNNFSVHRNSEQKPASRIKTIIILLSCLKPSSSPPVLLKILNERENLVIRIGVTARIKKNRKTTMTSPRHQLHNILIRDEYVPYKYTRTNLNRAQLSTYKRELAEETSENSRAHTRARVRI